MQKALSGILVILMSLGVFSATSILFETPLFAQYYPDFQSWCKNTVSCIGIEASSIERERQYQRWLNTLPPEERRYQEQLQLQRERNEILQQQLNR